MCLQLNILNFVLISIYGVDTWIPCQGLTWDIVFMYKAFKIFFMQLKVNGYEEGTGSPLPIF